MHCIMSIWGFSFFKGKQEVRERNLKLVLFAAAYNLPLAQGSIFSLTWEVLLLLRELENENFLNMAYMP